MPKPRKMLGKADSPTCLAVMQLIETQSRTTLARWAIAYAEQTCLPLYEDAHPGEDALRNLAAACAAGPDAKAIKPQLRELVGSVERCYRYDQNIMNLVTEESADFFAGNKTAEQAASLIQDRVSIYVAEQS